MKPDREVISEDFNKRLREHPHLTTTKGNVPWSEVGKFRKVEGGHENDNEIAAVVEYWDGPELVHRSVHVHLKRPGVEAIPEAEGFR